MLVPVTTVRQGTPTVAGDSAPVLAANASVGDTTLSLNVVPDNLAVGAYIVIDAYTTQAEVREITSVVSTVVGFSSRLQFSHATGDAIFVLGTEPVSTRLFGLTGDGTDEWQPLQRMFIEAGQLGMGISGEDAGVSAFVQQPLLIDSNTRTQRLRITSRSGFAPVDTNGAMVIIANGTSFFKATGADDIFTTTSSDHTTPVAHGLAASQTVAFNNPYGETLPGSLVSGRVYYVKTTPTTSTFTISATDGGATFDVTSDGTGWMVNDATTGLARIHWESVQLSLTIADLNGLWANLQQPSWTRNLRIDMGAAASAPGGATGFILQGQLSYHDNIEINTIGNTIGMQIEGSGHIVRGFNDNGSGSGTDVALVFNEADNCAVHDPWTENCSVGIRLEGSVRAVEIGGTWIGVFNDVAHPMLLVTTNTTSYRVGLMRVQTASLLMVSDTARGIALHSDGGADSVGDPSFTFGGLRQPYGDAAPILAERRHTVTSTNATIQHGQGFLEVNATGGAKTMTLPATTGWLGWTVSVCNASTSGVNLVTVNCTGAETIDGEASITLALGETVTFIACGGAYRRVSQYP